MYVSSKILKKEKKYKENLFFFMLNCPKKKKNIKSKLVLLITNFRKLDYQLNE